jgi:ERCC4-type nuclease
MASAVSGVTLVLDNREHGLAAELTRRGVPFVSRPLDVGDIAIFDAAGETPLLVAERKTHADFAMSNTDGRYREQRARLMAVRGGGVAVLYILEGTWTLNGTQSFWGGRMTEEHLQRLTSRLLLRYGLPVLATASLAETARWCQILCEQLKDDPAVFHPEDDMAAAGAAAMASFTASLHTVKKANKTPTGTAGGMLSAIPGLGAKRVSALLAVASIAELAAMTVTQIAALEVGGKRIGDKLAATIAEALAARG